jgi:ankyrin repeat protein
LLAHGADVNAVAEKYGNALTVGSASRNEGVALLLLDNGADPNVADMYGISPLHYAVARGVADITSIAPTAAFDEHYKVRPANMPELVKALLARGATPNVQIKKELPTFGTVVALNGPGAPSMVDATPLFLAALSGDVPIIRMLLDAGADPHIRAERNTTTLLAAAAGVFDAYRSEEEKRNALEAVKLLVELGIDVNEANIVDQTPMHGAGFTGNTDMVQFLADKGAKNGETPWSMASGIYSNAMNAAFWTLQQETADLLLKLGAIPLTLEEIELLKRGELGRAIYAPPRERSRD